MQIDISTVITIISVAAAVYFSARSNGRQHDGETSAKATEMGMINTKLDSIGEDTKEIKREMADVKKNVNDLSQRVVIVEQSAKSAHHRLDGIEEVEFPYKKKYYGGN